MSEGTKAVFLSYASQDKDVAKRICDALRAAGVEVWFDQSELRGGDAWDAMIRKRIKECALFVPVITPNTNARAEGYFRLEWKLAVDRSHLMADDAPFLFPIVIGDVTDATARVPDKFREVQWTRLRLDETPGELAGRVARLLSGNVGSPLAATSAARSSQATTLQRSRWQWWMIFPVIGTIMGLMFAAAPLWKAFQGPPPKRAHGVTPDPKSQTPDPKLSEARQLTGKARTLIEAIDSTADDFAAAESLIKRALELDATDGEVWAVSSRINSSFLSRGFERSTTRRETARSQAERAVKLAPDLPEAWLALGRAIGMTDAVRAEEALRRGLTLAPENGRLQLGLASIYRQSNRFDEALVLYERAATQPEHRALALYDQYLIHFYGRRFAEADRCLRESISVTKSANMVAGLALLNVTWRGDVPQAQRVLADTSADMRGQTRVVLAEVLVNLMAGQPDEALRAFDRLPADYVNDAWYTGPKALLAGLAHFQAGRQEAARIAWESGLAVVRRRLQEAPNDLELHLRLGELLAWTGQAEAALQEARIFNELQRGRATDWTYSSVRIHAALGRVDDALPLLEQLLAAPSSNRWPLTPALLRIDPLWSKLRGDPRFQKLCEEPSAQAAAPAAKPADKSVAVLAFANLSDDKANEYFSDGISEELLNVLAKVPKLKVAARTSSFYFKGRNEPIPGIAQKLGVAYVVEGSVRKAGNKVRITAQLIKADGGFHVWSETYDRDLTDIFAVQDEIAKNILSIVKGSLLGEAELPHAATTKIEAYTLFLQAQGAFSRRGEAGLRESIRLFEAALAIAPDYVPALVGLAQARGVLPNYAYLSGAKAKAETAAALQAARRALELDSKNAAAFAVIGWAKFQFEWRWTESEAALLRARDLAPNDAWTWNCLGDFYRFIGDLPQALVAKQREWELDPLSPNSHWDLSYVHLVAGNHDQAIHWGELSRKLAPQNVDSYMPGILAAGRAGRFELMRQTLALARQNVHEGEGMLLLLEAYSAILEKKPDEARRALAKAMPLSEDGTASPAFLGYCLLLLGDADQAALWLRKGYDRSDPAMVWNEIVDFDVIAANPLTRPILDQPGLKELYEFRQRSARAGLNKL